MKRFAILYFIVTSLLSAAQTSDSKQTKIDTLTKILKEDSVHIYRFKKIRPYLNYHERNSLGNPKIINFYGPQIGVVLFEKHIVGLGDYYSTPKTKLPYPAYDQNMEVTRSIEIRYATLFYQYILINKRFYELHLPFEFGYGNFYSSFITSSNYFYKNTINNFNMGAAGLQFIIKPVRWVGISGNLGYRASNERIIDGYYYAVGIWVGFKPILTDFNYYLIRKKRYRKAVAAIMAG